MDDKKSAQFRDRLMRMPEVERVTGLSRSSIYRLIREEKFVPTINVTRRCVAWSANAVHEWVENAMRDKNRPINSRAT